LILSDPGNYLHLDKNIQLDAITELRDIMPTLLDVANVEIPSTVEGESLLRLWKQEETEWRDYIHGEHEYGEESFHYITDGKEKYIWFSQTGEEQFFDLVKDPQELIDLAENKAYQKRVERCRKQLIDELTGREEGYTDGKKLIVGQAPKPTLNKVKKE